MQRFSTKFEKMQERLRSLANQKIKSLPEENLRELRQVDQERGGSIKFCTLPDKASVGRMGHESLIEVLRFCPASELFGSTSASLNCQTISINEARSIIRKMIQSEDFAAIEVIHEDFSQNENYSSQPSHPSMRMSIKLEDDAKEMQIPAADHYHESQDNYLYQGKLIQINHNSDQQTKKKVSELGKIAHADKQVPMIEEEKQVLESLEDEILMIKLDPRLENQELKFLMKHRIVQKLTSKRNKFIEQTAAAHANAGQRNSFS